MSATGAESLLTLCTEAILVYCIQTPGISGDRRTWLKCTNRGEFRPIRDTSAIAGPPNPSSLYMFREGLIGAWFALCVLGA